MRTARRSLVAVLALVISVFAVPAHAGDDSPGLLDTLDKTVDSLTAPILPKPAPKAEPAPAPAVEQSAPKPAVIPTVVKVVSSTLTNVTDTVSGTLRSTPLAPALEPVLGLVSPEATTPEAVTPVAVAVPEQDLGELISSLDLLGASRVTSGASSQLAIGADRLTLTGSFAAESDGDATETVAQTTHIPGTSTLPDGGTSLTTTWLMLWAGVVAAGALIVRRSRTSA